SIFLILALVFTTQCAYFSPQKFSEYKEGEWQSKALVRDKKEQRSVIINLKIRALDNDKLRMDITSPVGTYMATVLLDGSSLQYLNMSEKTLYKTKATRESLRDIIKVPIEPQAFFNILFDRAFDNKNWSCVSDGSGYLSLCKEMRTNLKIEWSHREGKKRTVEIDHAAGSVQMNLYDFNNIIRASENAFTIKVPKSFKIKTL
ncbi:MAG: hypothetical protein ABL927_03135, partial [Bdellovibrionales bacterium]